MLRASNLITNELTKYLRSTPSIFELYKKGILSLPSMRRRFNNALFEDLRQKGYIHRDIAKDYSYLQEARNYAAHNPEDAKDIDWQKAFDIAKELLAGLREAAKSGYTFEPDSKLLDDFRKVADTHGYLMISENQEAGRTQAMKTIEEFLTSRGSESESSDAKHTNENEIENANKEPSI